MPVNPGEIGIVPPLIRMAADADAAAAPPAAALQGMHLIAEPTNDAPKYHVVACRTAATAAATGASALAMSRSTTLAY